MSNIIHFRAKPIFKLEYTGTLCASESRHGRTYWFKFDRYGYHSMPKVFAEKGLVVVARTGDPLWTYMPRWWCNA